MKVGELIKYLEGFDPELRVMLNIPDSNCEELMVATVEKVVDTGRSKHMCGRYEEYRKGQTLKPEHGQPFDVLIFDY